MRGIEDVGWEIFSVEDGEHEEMYTLPTRKMNNVQVQVQEGRTQVERQNPPSPVMYTQRSVCLCGTAGHGEI